MPIRLLLVSLTALALLAACGSDSKAFNSQDVTFAHEMIAHHQQAIDTASQAPTKTENADVLRLAAQIEAAQQPEITTMEAWLSEWKQPATTAMPGHGHVDATTGMMTNEDMQMLAAASGTDFDRMFLTMMIRHHQGAIDMAKTEQAKGNDTRPKQLAATIIGAQQAEIDHMNSLLGAHG